MIGVRITDKELIRELKSLEGRVKNMGPAFNAIGADIVSRIQGLFRDSVDPWGTPWAPLARSTQTAFGGKRAGGQPLRDTGELRNSIFHQYSRDRAVIFSNDVAGKVATHQMGGYSKLFRAAIPARPFFPIRSGAVDLPEDWRRSVLDIVARHIGGEA